MSRSSHAPPRLAAAVLLALLALGRPSAAQGNASPDARWEPIRRVFGQGESEDGYFRINLPRSDLHVRIGGDALDPGFEFTSYVGFVPAAGRDGVMAMGEVILLDTEVPAALAAARAQGVRVTAVHNHLLGETPRVAYVHVLAEGSAATVARELRAVFAASATPLAPAPEEPARADWSAIDGVLGKHSEAHGRVAEYVFPRRERLTVHGTPVKSTGTIESASEVVFQQLGGGRVASTGELYLLGSEVAPVTQALDAHGLHVTALHTHMLDDGPPRFWVHWYAAGDGATLARGVAAALALTHGATRAESGGGAE